jgi:hypothetical protein
MFDIFGHTLGTKWAQASFCSLLAGRLVGQIRVFLEVAEDVKLTGELSNPNQNRAITALSQPKP